MSWANFRHKDLNRAQINMLKVRYRSAANGRVATLYIKVPNGGGSYEMSDAFTRLLAKNEVLWFRVEQAKAAEIAANRSRFSRWLEALRASTSLTEINLEV
jgi:hypothetical protein